MGGEMLRRACLGPGFLTGLSWRPRGMCSELPPRPLVGWVSGKHVAELGTGSGDVWDGAAEKLALGAGSVGRGGPKIWEMGGWH